MTAPRNACERQVGERRSEASEQKLRPENWQNRIEPDIRNTEIASKQKPKKYKLKNDQTKTQNCY